MILLILFLHIIRILKLMKQLPTEFPSEGSELPRGPKIKKSLRRQPVINLSNTRYPIIRQICQQLHYNVSLDRANTNWDIFWTDSAVPIQFLSQMRSTQTVNHFPGMNNLSRKALLAQNLKRMQQQYPESYSFCPETFVLPQDIQVLNKYQDKFRLQGERATFIIKPEIGCQGKGIYLWQQKIKLQAKKEIVQLYIDRPLLYKGLKFDLRVYVLVANCDPLSLYIYNEGLVRFATEFYQHPDPSNIDQLRMHLTNYAINKSSPNYIFNDSEDNLSKGHKKSLAQFFQTLHSLGHPAQEYWASIKDIAVKTLISGLPWLKKQYDTAQPHAEDASMCFEILGLDFLIEEDHKVYLLQVNFTPSFNTETPLDYIIKSNLVRDTLQLVKKEQILSNNIRRSNRAYRQNYSEEITFTRMKDAMRPPEKQESSLVDDKYLGLYERIYPCQNPQRQRKFDELIRYSFSSMVRLAQEEAGRSQRPNIKIQTKKRRTQSSIIVDAQPVRQKIRISKVLKQPVYNNEFRPVVNAFDRAYFKQNGNIRNERYTLRSNLKDNKNKAYEQSSEVGERQANIRDIIDYHQTNQTLPQLQTPPRPNTRSIRHLSL